MKCWKCGNTIESGSSECAYCGANQIRPEPASEAGKALRKLYDHYGAEDLLSDASLMPNGYGDLCPDEKKFKNHLRLVLDAGVGKMYLTQIRTAGKPDPDFLQKVETKLSEDAGISEKAIQELIKSFDEMIGWPVNASEPQVHARSDQAKSEIKQSNDFQNNRQMGSNANGGNTRQEQKQPVEQNKNPDGVLNRKTEKYALLLFWVFTIAYLILNLFDSLYVGWMIVGRPLAPGIDYWKVPIITFILLGMCPLLSIILRKTNKKKISLALSIIGICFAVYAGVIFFTHSVIIGCLWLLYPVALIILLLAVLQSSKRWMSWACFGMGIVSMVLSILVTVVAIDLYPDYQQVDFPNLGNFVQTMFYNTPLQVLPFSRVMLFIAIAFGLRFLPSSQKKAE